MSQISTSSSSDSGSDGSSSELDITSDDAGKPTRAEIELGLDRELIDQLILTGNSLAQLDILSQTHSTKSLKSVGNNYKFEIIL